MDAALPGLGALTLFVEDLESSASFYRDVLGLESVHQDTNSTVFDLGNTLVNLLRVETLRSRGVAMLNGPIDRPWGKRTAAFLDPSGTVWEIAQDIPT